MITFILCVICFLNINIIPILLSFVIGFILFLLILFLPFILVIYFLIGILFF